jgi:hypothetical protein
MVGTVSGSADAIEANKKLVNAPKHAFLMVGMLQKSDPALKRSLRKTAMIANEARWLLKSIESSYGKILS